MARTSRASEATKQERRKKKTWLAIVILVLEYVVKIAALGVIPENRRPGSAFAWLLLVMFLPVVGLPLFLLLGSPYVRGRRNRIQSEINAVVMNQTSPHPVSETYLEDIPGAEAIVDLNRRLAALPLTIGRNEGLHGDYIESLAVMTAAIEKATEAIHVEFYIMAWDSTTDPFFRALSDAVDRGVVVRLLFDHIGSIRYPGYRTFTKRLTRAGILWHPMMPIDPLRGRWRRPDLRNHRKLLVIDGDIGFMGSQNIIEPSYLTKRNARIGRTWQDLNIELTGPVVDALSAVFAIDWYAETGEVLDFESHPAEHDLDVSDERHGAFQVVLSGPGFPTEPNLRMFVSLMYAAKDNLTITSPYFVPDESLLSAITTAAFRGVNVELFVSEKADQFMVQHAQRSYYRTLLEAGVKIYLYPAPTVLHAKHFTVDGEISVIGSSNMDMRSFALDYEIMLLGFGADLAEDLARIQDGYRAKSRLLTLEEWKSEPWYRRYVDNALRLTSDLQ